MRKKIVLICVTSFSLLVFVTGVLYWLALNNSRVTSAVASTIVDEATGKRQADEAKQIAATCVRYEDTDGDGLINGWEEIFLTDKNKIDTDDDGYADLDEITKGYSPNDAETYVDTDGDGLSDVAEEYIFKSSTEMVDSDNDGITDFDEVKIYTDPASSDTLAQRLANNKTAVLRVQSNCQ